MLNLKLAVPGFETLPQDLPVVQTYDRIQAAFPGNQIPADVVIERGDASNVALTIGVHNLRERVERSDVVEPPVTVQFSSDHSVAVVSVPIVGDGTERRLVRGARRASRSDHPRDRRPAAGPRGQRHRLHRRAPRTSTS